MHKRAHTNTHTNALISREKQRETDIYRERQENYIKNNKEEHTHLFPDMNSFSHEYSFRKKTIKFCFT